MSTCVVTGGAGFLGSHLCEHLLGEGHRVICIDNLETGSLENIEHIRDAAFEFRNIDIIEYVDIPEDVDFVYHLASPASPIDYLRLPLHTLKVGSHGTHHMLGVAKFKRARFLIASTSEVYGDPQVHPQTEDYWGHVNPIGPRGVYDEAKRYAEALTMAYHRQQGVDTAIVRIFNTYGPRMRAHDGRAIPTFLRQALQDRPLTVFGDGSQTRSFCYVDDLIRGIVALAESDVHMPVNIGNPNEFTLLELAKTVIEVTESRSEIVYEALPTDDPQQRRPDIGRARDLLGWEPKIELLRRPAQDDRADRRRAPGRRLRLSGARAAVFAGSAASGKEKGGPEAALSNCVLLTADYCRLRREGERAERVAGFDRVFGDFFASFFGLLCDFCRRYLHGSGTLRSTASSRPVDLHEALRGLRLRSAAGPPRRWRS